MLLSITDQSRAKSNPTLWASIRCVYNTEGGKTVANFFSFPSEGKRARKLQTGSSGEMEYVWLFFEDPEEEVILYGGAA